MGVKCGFCSDEYYMANNDCIGKIKISLLNYQFQFFSKFEECGCNQEGSHSLTCQQDTGKCFCKPNIVGDNCDQCYEGYFNHPHCQGIARIE